MASAPVHRQLVLPDPRPEKDGPTARGATLALTLTDASWIELHRGRDAVTRYQLGAHGSSQLNHSFHSLAEVFPGLELGPGAPCGFTTFRRPEASLYRALPSGRHHFWPMRLDQGSDRAGLLLHSLADSRLSEHELLLQVLFRRVPHWESGFLSGSYERFALEHAPDHDHHLVTTLHRRKAEPAYHVEIRAAVAGPEPLRGAEALVGWLRSWTSTRGDSWWRLLPVEGGRRPRFLHAFRDHDMNRFAGPRGRRDVSATELAQILPIPWRERHAGLLYAGAPAASPPRSFTEPPLLPTRDRGVLVGQAQDTNVWLPGNWHHLAIIGKTRSGKSTLALNVALQLLASRPDARVVILEPAGGLTQDLVDRLPSEVAHDTVEVDPAHPTFERDGVEMAAVPLNLLRVSPRRAIGASEFDRRAERLSGDLLQAIRNAWGEESIGGRAEFVLRAVVQGLLAVEGTTLVDAYSALSDRKVLQRLERLAQGTQLKSALRVHLPKLDYSFTISSLDKVGKIATNPLLRKALCQRYRASSFDQVLEHRLVLLNLAKGALGSEASTFLGAIFLTQLWSAIQERRSHDPPVYLIVDEFHNFAVPAFADMLSEGARLGLHVVAITQYLDRIPEKVRAALVGNVDAWTFFAVGAEDAKSVWEIAQGSRFGWRPEHFVGGLGPHQAALALREALCKLETRPPPGVSPQADVNPSRVRACTRRLAQVEDSGTSPLDFSSREVEGFLWALPELEGRTRDRLAEALGWPSPRVEAMVALGKATGDLVEGGGAEVGLTVRGLYHRKALRSARHEGDEHSSLLADAAASLHRFGPRIVEQRGGFLQPDAEFDLGGRTYQVEVECTTLLNELRQVARNVRKALALRRRCLIVVPDLERAETLVSVLRRVVPEVALWQEVGVLWREATERCVPYSTGTTQPWGFLMGLEDDSLDYDVALTPMAPRDAGSSPDSDLARVASRAKALLAQGHWEVRVEDFDDLFGPNDGGFYERQRLGMALVALGIRSRRVRREGRQERVYDLAPLASRSAPETGLNGWPHGGSEIDDTGAGSGAEKGNPDGPL